MTVLVDWDVGWQILRKGAAAQSGIPFLTRPGRDLAVVDQATNNSQVQTERLWDATKMVGKKSCSLRIHRRQTQCWKLRYSGVWFVH